MGKITIEELKNYLRTSKSVEFEYEKTDGTKRLAQGTLSESFIPEEKRPKKDSEYKAGNNIRYFDVDLNEWRSIAASVEEVELKSVTMIVIKGEEGEEEDGSDD